jgi:integrase
MSHIVLDGSTHHFRYRIPQQFHPVIGQQTIKMSLKTGNKRLANQRAERLASATRFFFNQLHEMDMNTIPPAELKAKLRAFLEDCLYEDEGKRAVPPLEDRTPFTPPIPNAFPKDHEPSRLEMLIDEVQAGLVQADYTFFGSYIDRFMEQCGIEVASDSTDFFRIARGVYEMLFDLLSVQHCRATGDVLGEREYMAKLPSHPKPVMQLAVSQSRPTPMPQPAPIAPQLAALKPMPILESAVEKYIQVKMDEGWSTASLKDIPPQLSRFVEIVGFGIRVDELTRDHIRRYCQCMEHLPNSRHRAKYSRKTDAELMSMDIPIEHQLNAKSLTTRYNTIRSLFKFCEEEGWLINSNPLRSVLKVNKKKTMAKANKRRAFTLEELQALFVNDDYRRGKFTCAAKFWVPIIALFSGARLEEICQLYVDDIREIDGIMCFDINAEDDKDIKTEAGKRIVPIHPFLIEIGLLDRVAHLRANGEQHLFHRSTLSQADGKLSTNISKAFTYFRRKHGVGGETDETSEVVFHSFRHSVITLGKHKRVDRRLVKEVVGHEEDEFDDVTGGYEGSDPLKAKFEEFISQIDFDKVLDLGHLKGSMWVTKR